MGEAKLKSARDISEASDERLMANAKQRIVNFPILKDIYNDIFLNEVIENKRDRNNLLLFWLATENEVDYSIAKKFFEEIEIMLASFYPRNYNLLRTKL